MLRTAVHYPLLRPQRKQYLPSRNGPGYQMSQIKCQDQTPRPSTV